MPTNQQKVNELREKRANLQRALTEAAAARSAEQANVAVAVASNGEAPKDWSASSSRAEKNLEALELGLGAIENEIRTSLNVALLTVTKLREQRQKPAQREIAALKQQRAALFAEAAKATTAGNAAAPDFRAKHDTLEKRLATVSAELDAVTAEITAASAA